MALTSAQKQVNVVLIQAEEMIRACTERVDATIEMLRTSTHTTGVDVAPQFGAVLDISSASLTVSSTLMLITRQQQNLINELQNAVTALEQRLA